MKPGRMLATVLIATLALAASACRSGSKTWSQDFDEALNSRIHDLRPGGSPVPLKSLTTFEWDAVFVYHEGASNNKINADVGTIVFTPGDYMLIDGTLAVFTLRGTPVRVLILPPLTFDPGPHSADVQLVDGFHLVAPGSGS